MIRTDQDRPSVQYDDGADAWWIRASALGGCIRSLVATGRGVEPQPVPEWMQEKYNEGHDAEPVIEKLAMEKRELVPMGTHKGLHVSFTHGDQVVNVSGSVDNFAIHRGGVGVPNQIDEYKALGKSYVNAIERLGENPDWRDVLKVLPAPYSTQISVYMHGAAARFGQMIPVALVVGAKDENGVVQRILPIVYIPEPPVSLEEIEKRAKLIVDMVDADGDGEFPECDVKQYPCGHFFLHDDEELPIVAEDDRTRFRLAVDAVGIARQMTTAADQMKRDANAVIRDVMGENKKVLLPAHPGLDASAGEVVVSWVTRNIKERTQVVKAHTQEFPKITRRDAQKENK